MTEVTLWNAIQPWFMREGLDPRRIENALGAGTPDVNYIPGWIELKELEAWPVRPGTTVTLRKLDERKEQVAFLVRRWLGGGPCWVLLRVAGELLLFSGWDAQYIRRGVFTRAELLEMAAWRGLTPNIDLKHMLAWDHENMSPWHKARWCRLRSMKSQADLAAEMEWPLVRVQEAERGLIGAESDYNTLIEYWEC